MSVIENKHIPQKYLINSTENRLKLLAGLVDSDGHYQAEFNCYEITQKNKALAEQLKYLCDTLGFRCSLNEKQATIASRGYISTVYRLRIFGDLDSIPVRIEPVRRTGKKARPLKGRADWRVTGIQVEYDKVDDYYGFSIDGNRLFLLEDMTVTHNTAFVVSALRNAAVDHASRLPFSRWRCRRCSWSIVSFRPKPKLKVRKSGKEIWFRTNGRSCTTRFRADRSAYLH